MCAIVGGDVRATVVTDVSVGLGVKAERATGECVGVAVAAVSVTPIGVASSAERTHAKASANATNSTTNGPMIALSAVARTTAPPKRCI